MRPQLSIIIPTWNTAEITLKCIRTINKYLPPKSTQIVIVDNGSTDNTQNLVSKIENVLYLKNSANLGFAKGNNIGAKSATGDYLLFLNSDMELVDASLLKMLIYLKSYPKIGIIGPQFLNTDLTPQGSVMPPQTPFNAIKEYWLNLSGSYTKYTPIGESPINVWAISGGAVLISKEIFNKINGWDERYFFYYEDLELCKQIRKLGKQIYYYPSCKVIHRHGASGSKVTNIENQWRRLIPSAKLYHGRFVYYILFLIIWISQKIKKIFFK